MLKLPLGTTKTKFQNTWTYVDPQYIEGLGLWRVYPGVPEASDLTGLGSILPIVTTDLLNSVIKVSFDIEALPDIAATSNVSAFTAAHGLMQQDNLADMAPTTQKVVTIKPVQHIRAANKAILYFDIATLNRCEVVGHGVGYVDTTSPKSKVTIKDYNNSNGVNIDSEAPMVDEVIGSTATFSFDITTLPKV